jgi:hypothetical protein
MGRSVVARLALTLALLPGGAAIAGIVWAAHYPYHDLTETYVELLSTVATVAAVITFAVFWRYRR